MSIRDYLRDHLGFGFWERVGSLSCILGFSSIILHNFLGSSTHSQFTLFKEGYPIECKINIKYYFPSTISKQEDDHYYDVSSRIITVCFKNVKGS